MKKVLIVTYYWPPAGGPGIQRILKFVKYLPQFGWQPVILTVKSGVYPAIDHSLKADLDEGIKVYHSKNPEPDNLYKRFTKSPDLTPVSVLATSKMDWKKKVAHKIRLNYFIPDAKKFWRPFGSKVGKRIIQIEKPDIIFSSSPPPTTHLIAMDLAIWSKLPWIADFRDPWSKIHYYDIGRNKRAQQKDQKLEKSVIDTCNKVTCVSEKFADLLEIKDHSKLNIIHNGFDAEDFKATKRGNDKFKITYIGGLTANRYYPDFFRTIRRLVENNDIDSQKIEIGFAGNINSEIKRHIEEIFSGINILKFYNYLAHNKAIELMQSSNLLLLFNEKVTNYQGHLPGKLFEYLASGVQILGLGEVKGEASDIINACGAGSFISAASDSAKIIVNQYSNWLNGKSIQSDLNKIEIFNRKKLTEKLAQIFDQTTEN